MNNAENRGLSVQGAGRTFVWHGALMTLLGLLSGFTTLFAKAPTAALSAHTIGVVQGALLFGIAGAWGQLHGSRRMLGFIRYALLIGLYANWIGAQLAGFWSAKAMMIVTGSGMPEGAAGWMEVVVGVLLNLSALVIAACVGLMWVSRRRSE
jgi:hypothetical protein